MEEQVAAVKATCSAARERHEEMADMYRLRLTTFVHPAPHLREVIMQSTQE